MSDINESVAEPAKVANKSPVFGREGLAEGRCSRKAIRSHRVFAVFMKMMVVILAGDALVMVLLHALKITGLVNIIVNPVFLAILSMS